MQQGVHVFYCVIYSVILVDLARFQQIKPVGLREGGKSIAGSHISLLSKQVSWDLEVECWEDQSKNVTIKRGRKNSEVASRSHRDEN